MIGVGICDVESVEVVGTKKLWWLIEGTTAANKVDARRSSCGVIDVCTEYAGSISEIKCYVTYCMGMDIF